MNTLSQRSLRVALFIFAAFLVMAGSRVFAESDPIIPQNTPNPNFAPYGRVGVGSWEAECATIVQSTSSPWTFRKAARASKASPNCSAVANTNYLESKKGTNKVCLDFKDADRVGVGFVAGNYKGNLSAVVTFTDGSPSVTTPIITYDNYVETASSTASATGSFVPDEFEEGDIDTSGPGATLTFHAFSWAWEQNASSLEKRGTLCVNPQGKEAASGGALISLDYFVVAKDKPMAVRGVATGATTLTQDHVNALWTWSSDDFRYPPPATPTPPSAEAISVPSVPANWKGFIPKLASQTGHVDAGEIRNVIDQTKVYGDANIPRYWVIYNEPDAHPPLHDNPQRLADFIYNVNLIVQVYQQYPLPYTPKIIINAGSQWHIPGYVNPNVGGEWGISRCKQDNNSIIYDCKYPAGVWIEDFWTALQTQPGYANILTHIGGIEGHYYQFNDNNHCNPIPPAPPLTPKEAINCRIDTVHVTNLAQAMKNWLTRHPEIMNPEVWIMETGTSLIYHCGESLAQQVDGYQCLGRTANMRNYVGKMQKALGDQGLVNRWSWFADRYGDYAQCHTGLHDGEMTALNALCGPNTQYPSGVKLSPFARNFRLSAQYR